MTDLIETLTDIGMALSVITVVAYGGFILIYLLSL